MLRVLGHRELSFANALQLMSALAFQTTLIIQFSARSGALHFLNCGKRCGDTEAQDAVLETIADVLPHWSVVFLSEVDAVRHDLPPNDYFTHPSFRHWPGEGSFAMMFIVRRCYRPFIRSMKWRGRCGALHIFCKTPEADTQNSVYILGVHSHHGDLQVDTLADVAYLLQHRPWGSKVLVAGDWNVDQLPACAADPYSERPRREEHHQAERVLVQTLADRFRLSFMLPEMVCSTPGGPFGEGCGLAPISRIPTGECTTYCLPSLLDYGLSSKGFAKDCKLHWEGTPADHACITFVLDPIAKLCRGTKTSWKCTDENECITWICHNAPDKFEDVRSFHSFLLRMQAEWADTRTCKERREQRLPASLRTLYNLVANANSEQERKRLQNEAWDVRRKWFLDQKAMRLNESVQRSCTKWRPLCCPQCIQTSLAIYLGRKTNGNQKCAPSFHANGGCNGFRTG